MIRQRKSTIAIVLLTILASLLATAIVLGQVGGGYDLSWWTTDDGGGASSGGEYVVMDTLGQSVASNAPSFDGQRYSLTDGFWQAGSGDMSVYLPIVVAGSGP